MTFELVTTRNCNLNCSYCFEGRKRNECMNNSIIPEIIQFIENYKTLPFLADRGYVQIDFNGGETLLNKEFLKKFILCTQNYGYKYSITTNGILLDDDFLELINKYDIILQVSLDGKKETHDFYRKFYNGTGSYDYVFTNLKKLQLKIILQIFLLSSVLILHGQK